MIDLIPSEDQQVLLDSFTSFLREEAPVSITSGPDLMERIAALGWLGLSRPERVGGAGLGAAEEMLLLRECGRFLVTPSLMATLLAIRVADGAEHADLAEELANGTRRAALALTRDTQTLYVLDDAQADLLVVIGEDSVTLHPKQGPRTALSSSDDRLSLAWVPASGPLARASAGAHARLMLAAQLTGIAEAIRDMAVEYAKVRKQFDQPIGSFQAIKHTCANLAIRAEAALAQTSYAALCVADASAEAEVEVAAAVRVAADAAIAGAEANIQLHGAMGFTQECHAHLYLKRAHVLALFDGRTSWQTQALLGT